MLRAGGLHRPRLVSVIASLPLTRFGVSDLCLETQLTPLQRFVQPLSIRLLANLLRSRPPPQQTACALVTRQTYAFRDREMGLRCTRPCRCQNDTASAAVALVALTVVRLVEPVATSGCPTASAREKRQLPRSISPKNVNSTERVNY